LAAEWAEHRTRSQEGQHDKTTPTAVLLAGSCYFAVTVKLSIVPILLLLLVPFIFGANRLQYLRVMLVTASLIVLPFVGRNIVLSGYVVYPSTALDLFNPSWKVPAADVEFQTKLLKSWAMMPALDWYRASEMSWGEWLGTWYRLRHDAIVGTIPWLLLGFGAWICANIRQWRHANEGWAYNLICTSLLAGVLFCFFTAPDPRFAMPWIMTFSLIAVAWLVDSLLRQTQWSTETYRLSAQIALLVATCWFVGHSGPKRLFRDPVNTLCQLNDLPKGELEEVTSNYGVRVNLALNTKQAWNADLPNTPDFNRWLQLRGKTLAEGFVVTKPFAAEWRPGM